MMASAHITGQTLGLQPGDAALVCLNIRYVAGIMMLVRSLELGLPMTVVEPSGNPLADFNPVCGSFCLHGAGTAPAPDDFRGNCSRHSPKNLALLNGMKAILVGGAATSPALEQAFRSYLPRFMQPTA